jgi:RhtB (resistance to homoserine/threonine) family protein
MEYLVPAVTVFGLMLVGLASPGPDFLCVLRNSLSHGCRIGIITAAGIASGVSVHIGYCVAGLALVISQSIMMFNVIKLCGALYLVYLAIQALRSKGWSADAHIEAHIAPSPRKAFVQGFVTNVLNPKATLFFLALFTQFIDPHTPINVQLVYGLICGLTTFGWFSFVAAVLNHPMVRQRFSAMSVWIDRFTGLAFLALAAKLAFARAPAAS